jgi:hypothetical protein
VKIKEDIGKYAVIQEKEAIPYKFIGKDKFDAFRERKDQI